VQVCQTPLPLRLDLGVLGVAFNDHCQSTKQGCNSSDVLLFLAELLCLLLVSVVRLVLLTVLASPFKDHGMVCAHQVRLQQPCCTGPKRVPELTVIMRVISIAK